MRESPGNGGKGGTKPSTKRNSADPRKGWSRASGDAINATGKQHAESVKKNGTRGRP